MLAVLPLLILLNNVISATTSDKPYLYFSSDTSSLSYRPVFITEMIEEAIQTNSSLKLELISSQYVDFGFLKCGVYSLATVSKVRDASYYFQGESLMNLKKMIGRTCASDDRTSSFDLVIHSSQPTSVHLNFTLPAQHLVTERNHENTQQLRSMYPLSVSFNLPADSSSFYPIQMKALIRRIHRTDDSGLAIKILTNSSVPFGLSLERCGYEVPDNHFRFEKLKVYQRKMTNAIENLLSRDCSSEWLVDTVNVHVTTSSESPASGVISFEVFYPDSNASEVSKTTRTATNAEVTNIETQHRETTSHPNTTHPIAVIVEVLEQKGNWLYFAFFIIGLTILVIFAAWRGYSKTKRGVYHVANYEHFDYESVLP